MADLLVMYNHPSDPITFDRHYQTTHTALVKRIPGLRAFITSHGAIATPQGRAPYHLIARLEFASMADLQAGVSSPEGQAAVADLSTFAHAGADIVMFETCET